jgi:hypothetical protein
MAFPPAYIGKSTKHASTSFNSNIAAALLVLACLIWGLDAALTSATDAVDQKEEHKNGSAYHTVSRFSIVVVKQKKFCRSMGIEREGQDARNGQYRLLQTQSQLLPQVAYLNAPSPWTPIVLIL